MSFVKTPLISYVEQLIPFRIIFLSLCEQMASFDDPFSTLFISAYFIICLESFLAVYGGGKPAENAVRFAIPYIGLALAVHFPNYGKRLPLAVGEGSLIELIYFKPLFKAFRSVHLYHNFTAFEIILPHSRHKCNQIEPYLEKLHKKI